MVPWDIALRQENHRTERVGWLRAAVLGANDGLVSTASLLAGVAAAQASPTDLFVTGAAGLVAGAMSMAAGEYVSVSSQRDTEHADLEVEKRELDANPAFEREELAQIYVRRGLDLELARKVSDQLMAHDALGAHSRDELGIHELTTARPVQAAFASAASFAAGAAMPIALIFAVSRVLFVPVLFVATVGFLGVLGVVAARAGGARPLRPALRVMFWGAFAMALTAGIGALVGRSV
jgi:VIT1/CCC1 family predicted Fe2+/Mn2+ transporter